MRPTRPRAHERTHEPVQESHPAAHTLERLIFLTDGVMAIAMTLLVVELTLPDLTSPSDAELLGRLASLGPKYLSFVVSFLVIASYWMSHQRIFQYIVRSDRMLLLLNTLLLLCIAFQPFPTNVLGTYGDTRAAVTFYAATLVLTGLIVLVLWLYATTGHRLVRPDLPRRIIRYHTLRALSVPAVFLVSIAITQVSPFAARLSWLAIAVLLLALRWAYREVP